MSGIFSQEFTPEKSDKIFPKTAHGAFYSDKKE